MPRPIRRLFLRRTLLSIACVSLAWSLWLAVFGGFDTTVLGLRIRSNNAQRVLPIAIVAVIGFFLTGGRIPVSTIADASFRAFASLAQRPVWIASVLAIASTVVGLAGSTRIAGGSDAYGYLSQAELWLSGRLKVPQPWVAEVPWPDAKWTFTPLGYRPAAQPDDWSIVPTYSPGLPMLLAAAKLIGGQCAMFVVVPLMTGLTVLATFGIGYRLRAPIAGLIAAWFMATSPAILGSLEPLTDVPVMAAWTMAFYCVLGDATRSALAAGLFAALAILIRPNLFPLAAPMGVWLLVRRDTPASAQSRVLRAALFSASVLAGITAIASINLHLFGSAATSGYGRLEDQFAWARVFPNLRQYLSWLADTQTPVVLVGLIALLFPARRLWPRAPDRSIFAVIAAYMALLWGIYAAYLEFDSWGYLRFLLPGWPFIMLGLSAVAVTASSLNGVVGRWLTGVAVVALGAWTLKIAVLDLDVFGQRQAARHEAPIGYLVRTHTPDNSVVLTFERSGSMRYYGGRTTLRYDVLDGRWLDRAIDWLGARGVRVYAVLDKRQAAEAKQRFATERSSAAFDHPILIYEPAGTALYDLSAPPASSTPPLVITDAFADRPGCDPPVALPPLILR
jgi:hypothetical protein